MEQTATVDTQWDRWACDKTTYDKHQNRLSK